MEIGKVVSSAFNVLRRPESVEEIKHHLKETKAPQDVVNEREQLTLKELEEMTQNANDFFQMTNTQLQFTLHEGVGYYFVKVIDAETEEVIREVPPEKMLNIYAALREFAGILVDEQV